MKNESRAIKRLCDVKSKVSAHYFIKNNGDVINLVPDAYEAWHAGKSNWKKYTSLNKYSDLITNKDDSLFSVEKLEFIDQLKFGDIWTEELTQPEKDTIWQYIQILYLLSNLIHKTPNENI